MKAFWKIIFIVFGLIIYSGGCEMAGTIAFVIQFIGAFVMMAGLLPYLEKWTSKKDKLLKRNDY